MRLKVLIEDLFEISKATSNNVQLNISDVDIVNLIRQVRFEMEDKLSSSGLHFRWNLPKEKVILPLDSQKTYRVFENLLGNILKYAMKGSRVYIDLRRADSGSTVITMKNISATELNFDPKEITERFVRGDLSRNTEGSGLGLAIARSFVELQGGQLDIEIDGDLFKAIIVFP
ncbi:MAG: ATP-binding protein, partial [Oscillospiraceae bacterium]|nr:ATP-binding protein [Oscillospiraceae bacterium]